MMCFNRAFGDAPLGGYDIYVILNITYGRIYVKVAYDDDFSFRKAPGEDVLGGD